MRTVSITLAYLIGTAELLISLYFLKTNSRNLIRYVMAILAFSASVWVILTAAVGYQDASRIGEIAIQFVYLFGLIMITALFIFAVVYPFSITILDRIHWVFISLPVLLFGYEIFFTKTIIAGWIFGEDYYGRVISGPLHGLYNFYLLGLFIAVLWILGWKIGKLDGMHRENVKLIFWTILIGGLPGVIVDLILISIFHIYGNPLIGVMSTGIWLGGVSYILLRK